MWLGQVMQSLCASVSLLYNGEDSPACLMGGWGGIRINALKIVRSLSYNDEGGHVSMSDRWILIV